MAQPSILFATPMFGGKCDEPFFASANRVSGVLDNVGIAHDWNTEKNESLIHRGRMRMAARFLRTEHTHLFFIDADIEFTPGNVATLWNLQTDIACGVYAMKKPDKQWFAAWKDGELVKDLDRFDGPTEVDYAGTGFLLISRRAIERIVKHLEWKQAVVREIVDTCQIEHTAGRTAVMQEIKDAFAPDWEGMDDDKTMMRIPALFQTPIYNDSLESEDYHFCRIARQAGLKIVMDPSVRLKHWGPYAYGA